MTTEFRPTLQIVRVSKSDLITKLKANKDKHVTDYNTAIEGFRVEVKNQLDQAFAKFEKDSTIFDTAGVAIYEQPPQNHAGDYDQAITALVMSKDEEVYLTTQEISQYVMDNWSWKQGFTTSTTKYISNVTAAVKR